MSPWPQTWWDDPGPDWLTGPGTDWRQDSQRRAPGDIILSTDETSLIRTALATCTRLLTWAEQHTGPQFRDAVADATQATAGERNCPSHLHHDISLAIDYLDFAPAARKHQRKQPPASNV
jgi:hypothetical protein